MAIETGLDKLWEHELTVDFHLLGEVPFSRFTALQRRLADAAASGRARTLPVVLCEHPRLLTIGRSGSRAHIRLNNDELRRRDVAVRWVSRGGGCIPHGPGQLCIYPIVPLSEVGWSVGEYLRRLQKGVMAAVASLNLTTLQREGRYGVWGHSGLLAAMGVQVQDWVTHHGAYLNVAPDLCLFRFVDSTAGITVREPQARSNSNTSMSSLLAERRGAISMSRVRTAVIESVAESFGAREYHIHAGHPWLSESKLNSAGTSRRAV